MLNTSRHQITVLWGEINPRNFFFELYLKMSKGFHSLKHKNKNILFSFTHFNLQLKKISRDLFHPIWDNYLMPWGMYTDYGHFSLVGHSCVTPKIGFWNSFLGTPPLNKGGDFNYTKRVSWSYVKLTRCT